jgi:hypothetical protein
MNVSKEEMNSTRKMLEALLLWNHLFHGHATFHFNKVGQELITNT